MKVYFTEFIEDDFSSKYKFSFIHEGKLTEIYLQGDLTCREAIERFTRTYNAYRVKTEDIIPTQTTVNKTRVIKAFEGAKTINEIAIVKETICLLIADRIHTNTYDYIFIENVAKRFKKQIEGDKANESIN